MIEAFALILASFSLSISIVGLILHIGLIQVKNNKADKFEKYRNEDGLLGRKKVKK